MSEFGCITTCACECSSVHSSQDLSRHDQVGGHDTKIKKAVQAFLVTAHSGRDFVLSNASGSKI